METENMVSEAIDGHTPDFKEKVAKIIHKTLLNGKEFTDFILKKVMSQDINEPQLNPEEKLIDEVNRARIEWMVAKANFVNVSSDKDLVDQAIYAISAAEKKYLYLLKQVRKQDLTVSQEKIDYNRHMYKGENFNI